jgi:hypothetical protein
MKFTIRTLVLSVMVILMAGCCPYHDDYMDDDTLGESYDATVVYMGAPEVDGCGWLIMIDETYYYPVNLEEKYKIEDLPVRISYTYDPIEFRCGRGGTRYQSIRIETIRVNAPSVKQLYESDWDHVPMDLFRMDSAFVDGDFLYLHVNYSGGCRDHEFTLYRLPTNPRQEVELMLSHEDNDDMCEAWLSEWLIFSLKPLRLSTTREVTFWLRGSPEMSAYFGKFTYKY